MAEFHLYIDKRTPPLPPKSSPSLILYWWLSPSFSYKWDLYPSLSFDSQWIASGLLVEMASVVFIEFLKFLVDYTQTAFR